MATKKEEQMRSDLKRIAIQIHEFSLQAYIDKHVAEVAIYRELLTSWMALTSNEYQTTEHLQLLHLTKEMLNDDV